MIQNLRNANTFMERLFLLFQQLFCTNMFTVLNYHHDIFIYRKTPIFLDFNFGYFINIFDVGSPSRTYYSVWVHSNGANERLAFICASSPAAASRSAVACQIGSEFEIGQKSAGAAAGQWPASRRTKRSHFRSPRPKASHHRGDLIPPLPSLPNSFSRKTEITPASAPSTS